MSLYADEETDLFPSFTGAAEVQAPLDPVQALTVALSAPGESRQQADALLAAGTRYEEHPDRLPDLVSRLLPMITDGGDSLLRAWTLDMVALAVGRADLDTNVKLDVAQKSLDSLNLLLKSRSATTLRAVIPIFSSIYPMLFRATGGRDAAPLYNVFQDSKARILSLVLDPSAQPQSAGVKTVAWKFVQKVLLVGTRASGGDPRLKSTETTTSITLIRDDSVLSAQKLEDEANHLRTQLVTQLYQSDDPAVLHPILNIFPALAKARPALAQLLISSMGSWTPGQMENARRPLMQIRAVEKTLQSVLQYFTTLPALVGNFAQLRDVLQRQKARMEIAWAADAEERRRHRAQLALGKHPLEAEAESSGGAAKRARMEVPLGPADGRATVMIDVSQFALEPVVDTVMSVLAAIPAESLTRAFDNAKKNILDESPDAVDVLARALLKEDVKVEDQIINPLDMALDDEELFLGGIVEDEEEEHVTMEDFKLPPPEPLPTEEKDSIVDLAVRRIWDTGADLSHLADLKISDAPRTAVQPKEMWMLLLARVSSRGGEDKRRLLGEFVAKDFGSRSKFATVWLNEEWLAKRRGDTNEYDTGLLAILNAFIPTLGANQLLSKFLVGLPEVSDAAIDLLEPLCENPEKDQRIVGFRSLRDLVETRPPVRARALNTLLQLCTHPDRDVRVAAIMTVRKWVPNSPMSAAVVAYAFGVLRRLTTAEIVEKVEGEGEEKKEEVKKEEGEEKKEEKKTDEAKGKTPADKPAANDPQEPVPEPVPDPAWFADTPAAESRFLGPVSAGNISQYTEMAFALTRRDEDLLDKIFALYPSLPSSIQDSVEDMLTPLVRALGPTKKLLDILRAFPKGSTKLALRVVQTLAAQGSGPVLAPIIRSLLADRTLDPRFIIPVIDHLDKAEIEAQIPSIVGLLADPAAREDVKRAFANSITRMTPADLLVCLHGENDTATLKQTIEAINICLSMPTVFRADVLANATQRIADQSTPLPANFLRTVILALKTYKSLAPFVANNVLPKLVAKKVWETPDLWQGFLVLVRVLGQASFNALLQLPVEQIANVMAKDPPVVSKAKFKTFLVTKPQARKALAGILGD